MDNTDHTFQKKGYKLLYLSTIKWSEHAQKADETLCWGTKLSHQMGTGPIPCDRTCEPPAGHFVVDQSHSRTV